MDKNQLSSRITLNPHILVGKPTIRGLRTSVEQVLQALAHGVAVDDLLNDYPELEREDIQAAIEYAADVVASQKDSSVQTSLN